MKRNPKRARRNQSALQVWTFEQAKAAVPYLSSVIRSLREHGLEALAWQRTRQRLADRPGRATRAHLIALDEAGRESDRAHDRFQEAVDELHALDIFSLDPLQGLALVPFIHDEQLAWYVFDLFDSTPFRSWRYQSDPEETRRPLTSGQKGLSKSARGT